jgi:hypothetical protein
VGVSTALAGAAPSGDPLEHSTGAVEAGAVPFNPGTYEWYVDGEADGTITIASNNTFTADIGGDSGSWVQAGETFGLYITGGGDAGAACVFAGHAITSTEVSYAAKPGHWVCPGLTSGTFYIAPVPPGSSPRHVVHDPFAQRSVQPMAAGKLVLGHYNWLLDGDYPGVMTTKSDHTYTSTLSTNDSGTWIQSGSAATYSISGGADGSGGCVFVGKVNHTGTAVGTSAKPGNWVCPGYGSDGFFTLKKKS